MFCNFVLFGCRFQDFVVLCFGLVGLIDSDFVKLPFEFVIACVLVSFVDLVVAGWLVMLCFCGFDLAGLFSPVVCGFGFRLFVAWLG